VIFIKKSERKVELPHTTYAPGGFRTIVEKYSNRDDYFFIILRGPPINLRKPVITPNGYCLQDGYVFLAVMSIEVR